MPILKGVKGGLKGGLAWLVSLFFLALINPIKFFPYTLLRTSHPFTDHRFISFKPFFHLS